jgi:hypothetical protein
MSKPPLPEKFAVGRNAAGELVTKAAHAMTAAEVESARLYHQTECFRLAIGATRKPDDQAVAKRARKAELKLARLLTMTLGRGLQ